jgi:acyl carrier protein
MLKPPFTFARSGDRRREPAMDDVAEKIIAILRKNMRNPEKEITLDTKLTDLEIESLDLAVIVFDIEDTFGIQIPYNANEEVSDFATVGSVVERVKAILSQQQPSNAAA